MPRTLLFILHATYTTIHSPCHVHYYSFSMPRTLLFILHATYTAIHSPDLQAYLSEEDIVEETAEDHMTHTLTLPLSRPHTIHNNDVIFVERKGE